MAYLKSVLLSKSEEDLIHDKSVECLQDVGIRVDSESVLELLEKEGASVDYENYLAKIPVKMVDQARLVRCFDASAGQNQCELIITVAALAENRPELVQLETKMPVGAKSCFANGKSIVQDVIKLRVDVDVLCRLVVQPGPQGFRMPLHFRIVFAFREKPVVKQLGVDENVLQWVLPTQQHGMVVVSGGYFDR